MGLRAFLDLGGKILGRGWRSPLADRLSLNKKPAWTVWLFQIAASSPRAVFGVGPRRATDRSSSVRTVIGV